MCVRSGKKRVLVVDDAEYIREFVAEALRGAGYEAASVSSGADALALFKSEAPDAVISDLKMEPMNGLELLETIKRTNPDVPFIIFSGYGVVKIAVECMQKGAFTFLEKDDALIQKILSELKKALEHRALIDECNVLKKQLYLRQNGAESETIKFNNTSGGKNAEVS